ncbi:MAG: flagella basal body P-ring formation protein FlgA [Bacillota bacterium]
MKRRAVVLGIVLWLTFSGVRGKIARQAIYTQEFVPVKQGMDVRVKIPSGNLHSTCWACESSASTEVRAFAQTGAALLLEIPEQVTVAGPKIHLADLGRLQGATPAERQYLAGLELGLAPAPGQTRFFTRSYLEFILKQQRGHRCPTLLMGSRVAVKVTAVAITEAEIAAAIDRLLPPLPPGVIKQWVQLQNPPETVWLPQGEWRIEAAAVSKRLNLGPNIFRVRLVGATATRTFNIAGVVRKVAVVYRANRDLAPKTPLLVTDFDQVAMELTTGRECIGAFPAKCRNIRSVRRGRVLSGEALQPLPQVFQDSEVQVTFNQAGIAIMVIGRAKRDGWKGDWITLVNPVSKKEFQGRVVGPGLVEVL